MKRYILLLCGLCAAGTLCAAEVPGARLNPPVLGYLFDETARAVRTISGVPGAASVGEPVATVGLERAFVHSGARVAMGVTKEGGIVLLRWGSEPEVAALHTGLASLNRVAFSDRGEWAALTDGVTIEVWTTGAAPELAARQQADGEITALAMNDTGAAAFADSTGAILQLRGGAAHLVTSGGLWTALAFDGDQLLAADALHHELVRLSSEGGRVLEAALPGAVLAILAGEDGHSSAALADSVLLISAGAVMQVACECRAKGLERLEGGAVLVRGTGLLLDTAGEEPRLTQLPNLFAVNAGGNQ
jgi:hypothetical protein